jgi:hypothetical protein
MRRNRRQQQIQQWHGTAEERAPTTSGRPGAAPRKVDVEHGIKVLAGDCELLIWHMAGGKRHDQEHMTQRHHLTPQRWYNASQTVKHIGLSDGAQLLCSPGAAHTRLRKYIRQQTALARAGYYVAPVW